ncbi:probable LRR receptor-like serine/threonine-protein kinase At1g29720 isoform X2 [Raphanus sativus]|uniref:non-specific serine/threonine protein kinase n=1 Tax=Raphanus sativus TaxID=3726 RepID=A0A9W3C729_RAPSA|nr:probable LRR receptor-like serine/threonine-protein kinase At1g29720 isoform X2 [Raphanus sativus]
MYEKTANQYTYVLYITNVFSYSTAVNALKEIATTLGIKRLNLSAGDPCNVRTLMIIQEKQGVIANSAKNNSIVCDCSFNSNTTCHIKVIEVKTLNLPGKLPPQLAKLRYLQKIDLCLNYLSGTIPMEWASLQYLTSISVCANRLTGNLPRGLQNFKNLTYLSVEANQFSGTIPDELGNVTSLTTLHLASNNFTGSLPSTLARLVNLEDVRVCDNDFTGVIPEFIGNWSRLRNLHLYASGLKGPIPDEVARLENLTELSISDTTGINSFPYISSNAIKNLILRNVSLSGSIPSYIWNKTDLKTLDLSFNKLTGEVEVVKAPKNTYLTGNMLSGNISSGVFLNDKSNIDLSYNNFSLPSSCQEKSDINTYRSSNWKDNLSGMLPCAGPIKCLGYQRSLHINCGGESVNIINSLGKINYQPDNNETTTASTNQHSINWGVSNTGDFTDDGSDDDTYIISTDSTLSGEHSDLYKTARRSALSLVYYAFCLENETYNVNLHFMEIQFTEELYISLGRRIFDVYIQGKLFLRDFNIKEEANGTMKPIVQELKDVNVTNHVLEIRLYWAGKGTTLIPNRGYYGPLISAISLCHSQERRCGVEKTKHHSSYPMILGAIGGLVTILFLSLGIYAARKKYIEDKSIKERAQCLQTVCFTWRQLQAATNNFDQANKLGEGGFGSVFKGELSNGTMIAVKQLSSDSSQGNSEFVNEIGMISGLNHPNLVKLYGCCVEKNQLLLVYEYMEKNSLALALYGKSSHKLNWSTRQKICVGIARGLEFLHYGSTIKMVHRDIKTTNVLLDTDFNAKISDFGLARLHDEEHSHISTKIAGTIGYMAPEYALWGQLTEKADVYSFGIVAMEIVSGRSTVKKKGSADDIPLINWVLTLEKRGDIMEVIDPILEGDFKSEEAVRMIKVALVCTNSTLSLRPTMSEAVQMLEGELDITSVMPDHGLFGHNLSISKLVDIDTTTHGSSSTTTGMTDLEMKSFVSSNDLYPLNPESTIVKS